MIVDTQQKQIFGRVPIVPGDLADGYLVQSHRDRSHTVLCHYLPKQMDKYIQIDLFSMEYLIDLIQNLSQQFPKLLALACLLDKTGFHLSIDLMSKSVLQINFLHKAVQCFHLTVCCSLRFQSF